MRRILASLAATAALAGCLSFPQTTDELRGYPGIRQETVTVNRSASAVLSTLTNRGQACLNFSARTQAVSMTMNAVFEFNYRTKREGNSLVVEQMSPNNVGSPGWYPRIVADVRPTSAGTQVTTYAPIGEGEITDAIMAWARGDTSPCPVNDLG